MADHHLELAGLDRAVIDFSMRRLMISDLAVEISQSAAG